MPERHVREVTDEFEIAKSEAQSLLDSLTNMQREVLERKARLETNDEISANWRGRIVHRRTIEEHIVAARKKLRAKNTNDAIRKFIILLTIVGEPTCGFVRVDLSPEDIEKILRDLSFESAADLLASPEFEEFMQSFRSTGPEALSARFGRWWIPGAVVLVALGILILIGLGFYAGNQLNVFFS